MFPAFKNQQSSKESCKYIIILDYDKNVTHFIWTQRTDELIRQKKVRDGQVGYHPEANVWKVFKEKYETIGRSHFRQWLHFIQSLQKTHNKAWHCYMSLNSLIHKEHKMTVVILLILDILNSCEKVMPFVFSIMILSVYFVPEVPW